MNDQPLPIRKASMSTWNVVSLVISSKKYDRGVPFSVTMRTIPPSACWRRSVSR
jgi:hypothetical protein